MKPPDVSLHGTYFDLLEAKYPDLAPKAGTAKPTARRRAGRRSPTTGLLLLAMLGGVGWLLIGLWPEAARWWVSTEKPEMPVLETPILEPPTAEMQAPETALPAVVSTGAPDLSAETAIGAREVLSEQAMAETVAQTVVDEIASIAQVADDRRSSDTASRVRVRETPEPAVKESLAGIEGLVTLAATEASLPLVTSIGPEWIAVSGDVAPTLPMMVEEADSMEQVASAPAAAPRAAVALPAASLPSEPQPLEVGGAVKPPRRLVTPLPNYPDAAWAQGITGDVLVRAIIDEHGKVAEIEVLRGLPYGMTEAAIEAIERWRFAPATRNGEAVPVYRNLSVRFET